MSRGSAVVEFVLVFPLVVIVLLGVVEVAVVARTQIEVVAAAREGARQAAVDADPGEAVAAVRAALGGRGEDARVAVVRPHVVGARARVTVEVPHAFAGAVFGGLEVPLRAVRRDARRAVKGQHGNVGPLMAVVLMAAVALAAVLADVGLYLASGVQAATAADAAALAAAPLTFGRYGSAAGPMVEAARLAASNGAALVSCSCPVDPSWRSRTVTVVVKKDVRTGLFGDRTIRAVGRAYFDPVGSR